MNKTAQCRRRRSFPFGSADPVERSSRRFRLSSRGTNEDPTAASRSGSITSDRRSRRVRSVAVRTRTVFRDRTNRTTRTSFRAGIASGRSNTNGRKRTGTDPAGTRQAAHARLSSMSCRPSTTLILCVCAVFLHATGTIICTTVVPDINPTPPLEFPSYGSDVKMVRVTEASTNKSNKSGFFYIGSSNKTTNNSTIQFKEHILRQLDDSVLTPPSQPFNVKISGNYTENYIENKYYNNRVEENWSTALTFSVILVMAMIVLGCSAFCMKKILDLKISKRQLLLEDFDDSMMSDLIHIQHV